MDIKSEIAGSVWKIVAQEGETIAADAPLIILESMKMEIPITAPAAGRLTKLHVHEQDMVAEGQIVATIETG